MTARLLRDLPVADLTIEDPPIEDVIEQVFATETPGGHPDRRRSVQPPDDDRDAGRAAPVQRPARLARPLPDVDARSRSITQFQYRVANYFYMIGMIAEPVIYLVVWSTVAVQQGGEVGGFTPGEFAAYYIVWTLVRNMNIVLTPCGWEERIKRGRALGDAAAADPSRSTTTSRSGRLEGRRHHPLAADRGRAVAAVQPDDRRPARSTSRCSSSRSGAPT